MIARVASTIGSRLGPQAPRAVGEGGRAREPAVLLARHERRALSRKHALDPRVITRGRVRAVECAERTSSAARSGIPVTRRAASSRARLLPRPRQQRALAAPLAIRAPRERGADAREAPALCRRARADVARLPRRAASSRSASVDEVQYEAAGPGPARRGERPRSARRTPRRNARLAAARLVLQ
jgi:hypothetical protein